MENIDVWHGLAAKEAASLHRSLDDLNWNTPEGFTVKPLYTAEDLRQSQNLNTLPGLPPYIRGPRASMYVGHPWTVRQYAGFSTAHESNAFYRKNLALGQKGLSVAFDLPRIAVTTQIIRGWRVMSVRPGSPWIRLKI